MQNGKGGWCSDARKAEGGFHPRQDSSSSQSQQEAWEPREQTETPHRVGIKPTTFSLRGDGTDRRTTAAPLRISWHINFSEGFFEICPTSRPHARFCLCSGGKTGVSVKLARNLAFATVVCTLRQKNLCHFSPLASVRLCPAGPPAIWNACCVVCLPLQRALLEVGARLNSGNRFYIIRVTKKIDFLLMKSAWGWSFIKNGPVLVMLFPICHKWKILWDAVIWRYFTNQFCNFVETVFHAC